MHWHNFIFVFVQRSIAFHVSSAKQRYCRIESEVTESSHEVLLTLSVFNQILQINAAVKDVSLQIVYEGGSILWNFKCFIDFWKIFSHLTCNVLLILQKFSGHAFANEWKLQKNLQCKRNHTNWGLLKKNPARYLFPPFLLKKRKHLAKAQYLSMTRSTTIFKARNANARS